MGRPGTLGVSRQVAVRFPVADLDRLVGVAADLGVPVAELVRRLVAVGLSEPVVGPPVASTPESSPEKTASDSPTGEHRHKAEEVDGSRVTKMGVPFAQFACSCGIDYGERKVR